MLMKFYAYAFEKVCEVVSILFVVAGMVAGFFLGWTSLSSSASVFYDDYTSTYYAIKCVCSLLCMLFGGAIIFMFNIVVFGFIAQITEIRKRLEK